LFNEIVNAFVIVPVDAPVSFGLRLAKGLAVACRPLVAHGVEALIHGMLLQKDKAINEKGCTGLRQRVRKIREDLYAAKTTHQIKCFIDLAGVFAFRLAIVLLILLKIYTIHIQRPLKVNILIVCVVLLIGAEQVFLGVVSFISLFSVLICSLVCNLFCLS